MLDANGRFGDQIGKELPRRIVFSSLLYHTWEVLQCVNVCVV